MCSFCLFPGYPDEWSLGISVLRDWYVINSIEDDRFGLAPSSKSGNRSKPELHTGPPPSLTAEDYKGELRGLKIKPADWVVALVTSLTGILTLAFSFFVIWELMVRYRPSTRELML